MKIFMKLNRLNNKIQIKEEYKTFIFQRQGIVYRRVSRRVSRRVRGYQNGESFNRNRRTG